MKDAKEFCGSLLGTALSATGTALQLDEVLRIISLVLTIIGVLVNIALGVRAWYKDAMKDGKITKDEVKQLGDVIEDGIKSVVGDKQEEEK